MYTNISYINKVIRSCKTPEQVDTCGKWIETIKFNLDNNDNVFAEMNLKLDFRLHCIEMKEYLKKVKELPNGNGNSV